MKQRYSVLVVSLTTILIVLLTSCSSIAVTPPTPVATQESHQNADTIPIKLVFIAGPGLDLTKKHVAAWNAANPNVQVELVTGPRSGTDRYGLYLQIFQSQSSEIDLFEIDVIWPGDMAEHLVDLNEYGGAEAVTDDFFAIVTNNTVDGRLVGLPLYIDGGLLYYRSDLLAKYDYDSPPATWHELEEAALRIQEGERAAGNQDFWGFVWQGYAYEGLTCDALEWIYSSGGGSIVSPDKVLTINNDAAASALDMAHNWIGKISPPGVTGFMEEDSRRVWQGGNAAFMRNWPYAYSLGNADDSAIKGKFDVTILPGAEAGMSASALGGWQLSVSNYSKHPKEAAEFAKWFVSEELQKERAINLSILPTKGRLYKDEEIVAAHYFIPKLLPVFMNAVARPSTATAPHYNEVSNVFFANVSSVLSGNSSGADAVLTIEQELEGLLSFEIGSP